MSLEHVCVATQKICSTENLFLPVENRVRPPHTGNGFSVESQKS